MEKSNKYGVCYPVEYFNPHVHLEYDNNNYPDLNEAEIKALQYEEYKNKNNENKKLKNQEFTNKYSINLVQYQEELKMKNKEEEAIKQKEKTDKLIKNKNFNKTVFEKNMKPFTLRDKNAKSLNRITKTNNNNKKHLKEVKVVNHSNGNINIDIDMNVDNNKYNINNDEFDKFVPKKRLLKSNNNQFSNDNNDNLDNNVFILKSNLNINDNIYEENMDNNLNINENKNNEKDKINLNENIVDLRGNIEEQLLEELKNKKKYHNNEINDEINEKISNIKRFRNHGFLPPQNEFVEEKKTKKKSKNKKFFSEFERKRFIKALKHIITERLGEHNIYIQNICNCGNLQKQLTALVEKGNLTVYALTEVECANNCVFYKNKKAYLKSINDVLDSIKDIAYENFHNKYKD